MLERARKRLFGKADQAVRSAIENRQCMAVAITLASKMDFNFCAHNTGWLCH